MTSILIPAFVLITFGYPTLASFAWQPPDTFPFPTKTAAQTWIDGFTNGYISNIKGDISHDELWGNLITDNMEWIIDDNAAMGNDQAIQRLTSLQSKISITGGSCSVQNDDSEFPGSGGITIIVSCQSEFTLSAGGALQTIPVRGASTNKLYFDSNGLIYKNIVSSEVNGFFGRLITDTFNTALTDPIYMFEFGDIKFDQFDVLLLCILTFISVVVMLALCGVCYIIKNGYISKVYSYAGANKYDSDTN